MIRVIALIAALLVAFPTFATGGGHKRGDCNGIANCNKEDNRDYSTHNEGGRGGRGGDGGTGVGIGLGVGKGGNADVDNTNKLRNDNWLWTDVNNKLRNEQNQGQFQGQGQFGIVTGTQRGFGSGNETTTRVKLRVEGDRINYEAPKKPDPIVTAPDVHPSPATAPCLVPWGASGGSGAALLSLGASGATKDHGCAFGEVARRANDVGNKAVAEEALAWMLKIVKQEAGVADDDSVTDGVATTESLDTTEQEYVMGGRDEAFSFQRSYGE